VVDATPKKESYAVCATCSEGEKEPVVYYKKQLRFLDANWWTEKPAHWECPEGHTVDFPLPVKATT